MSISRRVVLLIVLGFLIAGGNAGADEHKPSESMGSEDLEIIQNLDFLESWDVLEEDEIEFLENYDIVDKMKTGANDEK